MSLSKIFFIVAGIEDVLQLGDALENMFYDDEDNDPLYHAHKISTNDMDPTGFDVNLSSLLSSHGLGNSGGVGGRNQARFLSNGNLPSSAIGNFNLNQYNQRHQQVPSPAPNGRVPSPAPGDAAAAAAYALSNSDQFPQANFISNVTSNASGNVTTIPLRSTHSSLSTIPEVPAELNKSSNVMNVINQNKNVQQQLCTEASSIHKSSTQHHPPLLNQPQQKRTLFQQSSRYHPSISNTIGGGIIRGVHPSIDKFHTATPSRFGVPPTCQNPDMLNHYPPDILVHSTSSAAGPLTSTSSMVPMSSNNWQEQSFDSSIVTESHYDASFESEIPPMGLSIDRGIGQNGANNSELMPTNQSSGGIAMSNVANINTSAPLTTSQRQQKNVFQQRKGGGLSQTSLANNDNEMGKVSSKGGGLFGIAGFGNSATEKNSQNPMMPTGKQGMSGNKVSTSIVPAASHPTSSNQGGRMITKTSTGGGIGGVSSTDNVAPNSLMLWKKVQTYVAVGGAFVAAGQQASSAGGNNQNNPQQPPHGNTVVATAKQPSLHQ